MNPTISRNLHSGLGVLLLALTQNIAILSGLAQPTQPFLTNGLVAYYPLNGNANDQSGNGNDGTAEGGLSYGPGFSADCASFNGTNQYVSLPALTSLVTNFTVAFWMNTAETNVAQPWYEGIFLVSRDICDAAGFCWDICLGDGRKVEFVTDGGPAGGDSVLTISNDLPAGQWVHVACVADAGNQVKAVYVNGEVAASAAWSAVPFADGSSNILVGASLCSPTSHLFYQGLMEELRIYERALSMSDVAELYQYTCVPYAATATATVVNGFVVGATLADAGCGYTNTPTVRIIGGGGSGAEAVAVVANSGVVAVNVLQAGSGYTSLPVVVIAPPFIPRPTIAMTPLLFGPLVPPVSVLQLNFANLSPYDSYQMRFSPAPTGPWTKLGNPFIPTASTNIQYFSGTGNAGFVRVEHLP